MKLKPKISDWRIDSDYYYYLTRETELDASLLESKDEIETFISA